MEGWKFWWGIAAFFLGGLATQLNGWLTYRRQRADKAEDTADAVKQRRETFELQHLVEVNGLLRAAVKGADAVVAEMWPETLGAEVAEDQQSRVQAARRESSRALDDLSSQVGFILDDQVRSLVNTALSNIRKTHVDLMAAGPQQSFADIFGGGDPVDPYRGLTEMVRATGSAYEAISARVRQLYAGQDGTRSVA
ncbi:hypothetical protein [Streptomyces sp. 1222.5]|uniref:hypothetical protein n=1 Tax=Streptomyces sp. 1222.5 TaxID=1881026 RepID=UPI003D70D5FD